MFKNLFFIFFISFFLSTASIAQNKFSSDSLESITGRLFKNKKWNELISYGKVALSKGVVSFNLYTRLGMAYYKSKKYFDAIPCFEKAIELTYNDPMILKYLYYSYKKTGRIEDKNCIFYDLPERIKKNEKPFENSLMDNLHVSSGKVFTDDFSTNTSDTSGGNMNSQNDRIFNGDEFYFDIGFNQIPLRWVNISYDYTYGKLSKRKQIQIDSLKYTDGYYQYQNRFYNRYDIRLSSGLILSPAGHYVSVKDNTIHAAVDSNKVTRQEKFSDDFILSLEAAKYFSIFKAVVNGSFSYLNARHQSQIGLSLKSYPSGNTNFFAVTSFTLHNQNKISNLIFSQIISSKLYKNLHGTANFSFGKMNNFNEQNGFIIYNSNDAVKYKIGAELVYSFPHNLSAGIAYVYQKREKDFPAQEYNANSIHAGINFGF